MGECKLQTTIQHRRTEIENLLMKLETIRNEVKDLRQADEDFVGDSVTEAETKLLLEDIEKMLSGYEEECRALKRY